MFPQCRQSLGYCPQFDALDPLLTGREHLRRVYYLIYNQTIMLLTPALCRLYARLRGLDEASVTRATSWGLRKLGLAAYADRWRWWQLCRYCALKKILELAMNLCEVFTVPGEGPYFSLLKAQLRHKANCLSPMIFVLASQFHVYLPCLGVH